MLQGHVDFHVGDEVIRLGAGGLVAIQPNVTHYIEVVGDEIASDLEVFTPTRPEYTD